MLVGMNEGLTDSVAYTSQEIRKRKCKPYQMANEPLAEEMMHCLLKEFPNLQMVKFDIMQWLVINPKARISLEKQLEEMIAKRRKEIEELWEAVMALRGGSCQHHPGSINTGKTAILSAPK